MKTPIQYLLQLLLDSREDITDICTLKVNGDIMALCEIVLTKKEKEFARLCFEAGMKYGMDSHDSIEWAEEPTAPDFEEWYKQFEL